MSGLYIGDEPEFQPLDQQIASLRPALRIINEAIPLLDQAGYDVAATHLQFALDMLTFDLSEMRPATVKPVREGFP